MLFTNPFLTMTTLNRTISTLQTVSSLLTKLVQEGDLCFTDKLQLALLCDELRDTNGITKINQRRDSAEEDKERRSRYEQEMYTTQECQVGGVADYTNAICHNR